MRLYRSLVLVATLLAFGVISLGAYVRLSDSGLGCPDWPGCYGQLIGVPAAPHEKAAALLGFPDKPVDSARAWKEMVHRYAAGTLGLLLVAIAAVAWKRYQRLKESPLIPTVLLAVIAVQALLGMWTVTLLLKPVIVSAHLLGGMTTLALLVGLLLSRPTHSLSSPGTSLRLHAAFALLTVIVQITLGVWVSSNQAALACGDFPTCGGAWLPEMDFSQAFRIVRELGQTAAGERLPITALTAIHWTHRAGALIVALIVGTLALRLIARPAWRGWGLLIGSALLVQIGLGVASVVFALPLPVAVAHNAGAAALLSITLAINLRLRQADLALGVCSPQQTNRPPAPAPAPDRLCALRDQAP